MIKFQPPITNNYDDSTSREWLETNGIGGFAMGTISGANTRRYHSVLTSAVAPPLGRVTTVSKLEETVRAGGREWELSTNKYPGVVKPAGYTLIAEFRLDPFPIWTFDLDGILIEKRIFMVHDRNTTVVRWKIVSAEAPVDISLEVRPLLSFVDYHHLQHKNADFDVTFRSDGNIVSIRPYAHLPAIKFAHNAHETEPSGHWYRDFEYAVELERGFDHREDLFQPFVMHFDLSSNAELIISTDDTAEDAQTLEEAEIERRKELVSRSGAKDDLASALVLAADHFVVRRGKGHTIIAGYPWFSDWGRDTMIALPGLTLATGRPDIAREILLEFSKHISRGMLPNRFPDEGNEPEYNTVDATLWYFEAIRAFAEETAEYDLVGEELYEKLADIILWHMRGTRYGIRVDTDGLLSAGEPGVQLTWMDAKIGDLVITPRTGKPVEIQALWYNALRIMADLAERFGHDKDRLRFDSMADLAKLSFNGLFWNAEENCLFDVVGNGTRDVSIRPNQIFAVSLAHPILNKDRWQDVVEKVHAELLTPFGLRSLSPRDPAYAPIYTGSPFERDSAYHQGTVWAWLIGPFIDAYRKAYPDDDAETAGYLTGFREHLRNAGLGQISEIFDSEPPHVPRGCPAQAWSVAEVLRVLSSG